MHVPIHHLPHISFLWTHAYTSPKSPTHTTPHSLYSYTHLPAAHPTWTHGTDLTPPWWRLPLALRALLSRGGGQGWLATSGCYVRKQPDRHLAREPIASQSTLHQCLLLCVLISDSLNFRSIKSLSEEAKRLPGLRQSGGEDPMPLKAKSNKMSTSAEESASLFPQWRFGRAHYLPPPPSVCFSSKELDPGSWEDTRRWSGRSGCRNSQRRHRVGTQASWCIAVLATWVPYWTRPSWHREELTAPVWKPSNGPQTVGAFKIVCPPAQCPVPLGCPSWPA